MSAAVSLAPCAAVPFKRCACGRCYDASAWFELAPVGLMDDGAGGLLELRTCCCGSTLAIELGTPS